MKMVMRSDAAIELTDGARPELEKLVRARRTPQAVALRARIVLMTGARIRPSVIAGELGISQPTVRKWRLRFVEDGLPGLRNEPRPGRPRSLDGQRVAELLDQALQIRPAKQTHWSVRSFASEAAIRQDMAHRAATADSIRQKIERAAKRISATGHYEPTLHCAHQCASSLADSGLLNQ
jgi:putative transposase